MPLFRRSKSIRLNPEKPERLRKISDKLSDDIFITSPDGQKVFLQDEMSEDYRYDNYHYQFPAKERVEWLVDEGSFVEWDTDVKSRDPFDFPDYQEKIEKAQEETGLEEAILTGQAKLNGFEFALGVMDSRFIMASMGTVVGEKLTLLFERATERKLPVVIYIASGGARMQENILSLMQMAKVTQAVDQHSQAGLFYCSVLTNPTTGGVTASFAMQADVILAEPGATIGFAGKRVIQQNITSDLPEDFQTAEATKEYGFVDQIVPRNQQKKTLSLLLKVHGGEG